ncbi:electron transfer flavoprotein-ubiquinone oxidoreductase [Desulfobacterium sp. N47]|uniref:Electron transfer flavoprotein-ubiquinone oxidoreductase n=1 Tax=uncultured Desulfobacterium sp. TaxID=201089 RepID=E1YLJ5_9BACT|nr:Electron transfer flavoprotein-ubiquinone oxidoreductase [uncultured Desulfobacterium sp.]
MDDTREKIEFDVLFVGGGPASLAGAIRLMQLAKKNNIELEVALLEKGAEIGSHALSGAVLNPIALNELIPDFKEKQCPIETVVRGDEFVFLTEDSSMRVPIVPKQMHNTGFSIISLSRFTRWLGDIAMELGVNIFPGFAGKEVLYDNNGKTIVGVRTGDKGLDKDGKPKGNFEQGIDLMAKVTVFGEGARGSLMQDISKKLDIFSGKMPQVYETGIKEVIQLPENNYFTTSASNDIHTLGYPLGMNTPGGGFIYQMGDNKVAIGFLIALAYEDAMLDIYDEFMKFKTHPFVANVIKDGKVIEQGARTVSNGGYNTMPKLFVNGALFVGGCAAIQSPPALKGIHVSMKSGMLAAEAIIKAFQENSFNAEALSAYQTLFDKSWLKEEMYEGRNFAAGLAKKGITKLIHLGSQYITKGRGIVDNLSTEEDCTTLKPVGANVKADTKKIAYDGTLFVDKLTGVFLSKAAHREDQPCHIIVHDMDICVNECYQKYKSPCTRFCPGSVYEMELDEKSGKPKLKLNFSNCLHCKTCDVKDPYRNIKWTCPEGGEGPGYTIV